MATTESLTVALNLVGTFAFGLSGGILAVRKQMDLFGVLVLSIATGLGGGLMRDILLGHAPPVALTDWWFLASAILAGIFVFAWYNRIVNHSTFIMTYDAVGLSIFTVTGTTIALSAGLGPVAAILLGMLTGVGGGIVRDVLAAEVPLILKSEIYAVASLIGAVIIVTGNQLGSTGLLIEIIAAVATFTIRTVSFRYGWKIPTRIIK